MLYRFLQLPLGKKSALLAALLCFSVCIVLILVSYHAHRQLIRNSADLFGESITQQLARDASNPLVKGDKLNLQSLLNKLVESPAILHAAIYDIEHYPITEAGTAGAGNALSASITFQDTIAGYAVITFDTNLQQYQSRLLALQLALLALLLSSLVYGLSLISARPVTKALNELSQIARSPKSQNAHRQITYPGEDELQQLARDIIQQPIMACAPTANKQAIDPSAIILIESSSQTDREHDAFQRQLTQISKLYNGSTQVVGSHSLSIQFYSSDNEHSYPFQALCCAWLIQQSFISQMADGKLRIGLALELGSNDDEMSAEFTRQQTIDLLSQSFQTSAQGLLITTELYQHPSIQTRVKASAIDHQLVRVEKLIDPYQALLDQQLRTLRSQSSPR